MFELITKLAPEIKGRVKTSKSILINVHFGADLDAVGSSLGLKGILEALGKRVEVFSPQPLHTEMQNIGEYLKGIDQIKVCNFSQLDLSKYDLFLCLDSAEPNRVSGLEEIKFPISIPTIVVDHHPHNPGFGEVNLIIPQDTCTSEMIFRLAQTCNWTIPPASAMCLFIGIWGDTAQFMFPSTTTAETYKTAAGLIEFGKFNVADLIWHLRTHNDRVIRAAGLILSKAEELFKGQVLLTSFQLSDLSKYKLEQGSADAVKDFVVNTLSYTRQPSIIVIIYQKGINWYKISLRSNNLSNLRDVSEIAMKINHGGGHPRAAGADVQMSFGDARKLILEKIQETFPDLGQP